MARRDSSQRDALFFLGASLVGLCFVPLAIFGVALPTVTVPWQRQIIGLTFSIICLLGALVGISPSTCSRVAGAKSSTSLKGSAVAPAPRVPGGQQIHKKGHHATCTKYASHVVSIGGAVYCAGCTGLVFGAAVALAGSTLYFFVGISLPYAVFIFWLGFAGVALGLLQHPLFGIFGTSHGVTRVLVNSGFVIGAFLLLSSVAELTGNLLFEAYLLLVILYWIFTRIAMSKRTHRRICVRCGNMTCPLSEALG